MVYQICKHDNHPEGCADCLRTRIAHLEQQAARLANLPGLPGWISGKWTIDGTYIYGEDATYGRVMFAYCADYDTAEALLALLNTCYPPALGRRWREGVNG